MMAGDGVAGDYGNGEWVSFCFRGLPTVVAS